MKSLLAALLLPLAVSLVSAQDYNTSAPFHLKLQSSNANISGQYLSACHSGAAIEELCLAGTDVPPDNYGTYTLNVSTNANSDDAYPTGPLVWILPSSSINISSGLILAQTLYSNLALPMFEPGSSYTDYVGFDDDDKLFVYSGYYDESKFVAGVFPTQVTPVPLYHWYACYTYNEAYYYNTLAWVTSGKPINPTCTAVNVTREFV